VIVPAIPGTLLLSQWIATKAIPGKTVTNHIPDYVIWYGPTTTRAIFCSSVMSRHLLSMGEGEGESHLTLAVKMQSDAFDQHSTRQITFQGVIPVLLSGAFFFFK